MPESLMVCQQDESIFHHTFLSAVGAQAFSDAEFRDSDNVRIDGKTPLMTHCSSFSDPKTIEWLLSHGASLEVKQWNDEFTALHYLGYYLGGQPRSSVFTDTGISLKHVSGAAKQVLLSQRSDGCRCACSRNGCLPRKWMFRCLEIRNEDTGRAKFTFKWIDAASGRNRGPSTYSARIRLTADADLR